MAVVPDYLWPLVCISGFAAPVSLITYFCLRVYCVTYTQLQGQSQSQLGLAWFFLAIEFFQYLPTIFLYCNRILVPRRPRRPQLSLQGDDVPVVSVLITACGEDHDTILNVVKSACETDWPPHRLNVILCDDGRNEELAGKMMHVQRKYPFVHYITRAKPDVPDYVSERTQDKKILLAIYVVVVFFLLTWS
jgi:cellulose synthase/poly-beta-1,6-N-acetylglucosamine synthase-like glycosyltransferase